MIQPRNPPKLEGTAASRRRPVGDFKRVPDHMAANDLRPMSGRLADEVGWILICHAIRADSPRN